MAHDERTKQDVECRVADMLRLAERDYGFDLKRIARLSGVPLSSLHGYRNGTSMPLHVFVNLCSFLPDDLTTLCLEGAGKSVTSDDASEGSVHDLARDAAAIVNHYVTAVANGHPDVDHQARAQIADHLRALKSRRIA